MSTPPPGVPGKWLWHQRTLERLHDELVAAHREHRTEATAPLERGGTDRVDTADDVRELDTLRAEIALEGAELAEVVAALARLRNGSYGFCEATGAPIEPERLRAVPWTRLCAAAARRVATRNLPPP